MVQDVRVKLSAEGVAQVVQAFQTVQKSGVDATNAINDRSESEEQAAARIRDTVKASLEAQAASEALANATRKATSATLDGAKADADGLARSKAYTSAYRDRLNAQKAQVDSLKSVAVEVKAGAKSFAELEAQEKKAAAAFDKGAISLEEYEKLLAKLDQTHADLSKTQGAPGGKTGLFSGSALTDIQRVVRELATGQYQSAISTTSVLAQQVGLLEAVFSPLGLVVAAGGVALAAFAVAAGQGYVETEALTKALIVNQNAAGTTVDQLLAAGDAVGASTGKYSEARDAVLLLAQSGKVGAEGIQQAAQAAVEYAELTGKSIGDAVKVFTSLQDDPVTAAKALNEELGFLTASQYAAIKAAQDQGDTERAAALLQDEAAKALQARTEKVKASVGTMERAWNSLTNAVSSAYDAMKGVGRPDTNAGQLADVNAKLQGEKNVFPGTKNLSDSDFLATAEKNGYSNLPKIRNLLSQKDAISAGSDWEAWVAAEDKDRAQINQQSLKDQDLLDDLAKKAKAGTAKADEIKKVKDATARELLLPGANNAALLAQQKLLLADIEKRYATTGGTTSNELSAEAAQLRDDLQKITTDYTTSMAQLDAAHKAGTVSTEAYYQQAHDLLWKSEGDQVTAIQAELARLEVRKGTAKEQIQIDQRVSDLKSQLAKIETDTASKDSVLSTQRTAELKKEQDQVETYTHALNQLVSTRQAAIQASVRGVGQGSRANDLDNQIDQVNRDADERRYGLQRDFNRGQIGKDQYDTELTALDKYQKTRVQQEKDADAQLYDARKEWSNGAYAFTQDYADQAANTAQQTYSILGTLTSGISDNFAELAVDGKASWKDLADDIIKQMIRIRVQAAESGLLDTLFPAVASALSGGDNAAALSAGASVSAGSIDTSYQVDKYQVSSSALRRAGGGPVWGAGTSTSDSIDAKLSDGEYVVQAAAVKRYGLPALEAINNMSAPRFAGGGYVYPRAPSGFVPHFASGGAVVANGGTGGSPIVQVYDQRTTEQPVADVSTERMPNGQDLVKVFIRAAASNMLQQGSDLNKATKMAFGLSNPGVKRG